jgi:hypothetical protein
MAGTKTRFGYFGSGGDDPPGTGEPGAARTVIGRDLHLPQLPPEIAAAAPPTPSPPTRDAIPAAVAGAVAAPMTEAVTAAIPERAALRPRPSRIVRLLGRWTTSGHFRAGHGTDAARTNDDDLKLPRETAARNVLLVLAIAALTFLITFALMKWHAPGAAEPSPEPSARMAARPLPPTIPTSTAPPSPTTSPATSVPLPPTAATPEPKVPAPLAPPVHALRPHKGIRAPRSAAATMPPAHLQDELLPLNP